MDALVEVHTERELDRALQAGASLLGVNNRNLKSFEVSLDVSLRLAPRLPRNVVAVAESGIRSADDVRMLRDAGYRAFLVGESLMKSESPGQALAGLLCAGRPRRSKAS
jgi:indole-3-glycerol phosphate synthase